jgi:UDP-N-acetylglucosamine 2-epimerase
MTDSGGLQKEAYWLNTPCVTLRTSTEWIETLDGKHNFLISKVTDSSINLIMKILNRKRMKESNKVRYFGNGDSSKKIVSILLKQR